MLAGIQPEIANEVKVGMVLAKLGLVVGECDLSHSQASHTTLPKNDPSLHNPKDWAKYLQH